MSELFGSVVGHTAVIQQLRTAVHGGRLPHALLLAGPHGVGKYLVARGLAQMLLCDARQGEPKACGQCGSCKRVAQGSSESLMVVAPDEGKATISVEQIRQIIEFTQLRSFSRVGRVILIDQVHGLGPQAANLILKTLEEPPSGTHFLLVTSQVSSILSTIRSRCQLLRFGPLDPKQVQTITQCPVWVAEASRGSPAAAMALREEGFVEFRSQAMRAFLKMLKASDGSEHELIDDLRQDVKDRDQMQWLLVFWLQFCRDLRVHHSGAGQLIHQDLPELKNVALAPTLVDKVFQRVLSGTYDVMGNVDRPLILDNALINWARP
jgi:DNA polymerase-3 subunit delta'